MIFRVIRGIIFRMTMPFETFANTGHMLSCPNLQRPHGHAYILQPTQAMQEINHVLNRACYKFLKIINFLSYFRTKCFLPDYVLPTTTTPFTRIESLQSSKESYSLQLISYLGGHSISPMWSLLEIVSGTNTTLWSSTSFLLILDVIWHNSNRVLHWGDLSKILGPYTEVIKCC